ncbi:MAG: hypothetical protein WA705_25045 [Candidatus Ozemobacteraceae bacterium]
MNIRKNYFGACLACGALVFLCAFPVTALGKPAPKTAPIVAPTPASVVASPLAASPGSDGEASSAASPDSVAIPDSPAPETSPAEAGPATALASEGVDPDQLSDEIEGLIKAGNAEQAVAKIDEMPDVLTASSRLKELYLQASLELDSPAWMNVKLQATRLVETEGNDKNPIANFALGRYWSEGTKKTDIAKALKYLEVAKSSKRNAPPGAAMKYYKVLAKKNWAILVGMFTAIFVLVGWKLRDRKRKAAERIALAGLSSDTGMLDGGSPDGGDASTAAAELAAALASGKSVVSSADIDSQSPEADVPAEPILKKTIVQGVSTPVITASRMSKTLVHPEKIPNQVAAVPEVLSPPAPTMPPHALPPAPPAPAIPPHALPSAPPAPAVSSHALPQASPYASLSPTRVPPPPALEHLSSHVPNASAWAQLHSSSPVPAPDETPLPQNLPENPVYPPAQYSPENISNPDSNAENPVDRPALNPHAGSPYGAIPGYSPWSPPTPSAPPTSAPVLPVPVFDLGAAASPGFGRPPDPPLTTLPAASELESRWEQLQRLASMRPIPLDVRNDSSQPTFQQPASEAQYSSSMQSQAESIPQFQPQSHHLPQPEPQIQPHFQHQPEPEPQIQIQPKFQHQPEPQRKSPFPSQPQPQSQPVSQQKPQSQPQPQYQSQSQSPLLSPIQQQYQPEPHVKPQLQTPEKSFIPSSSSSVFPSLTPASASDSTSGSGSVSSFISDSASDSVSEPASASSFDSDSDSASGSFSVPDSDSASGSFSVPDSASDSDSASGSFSVPDSDSAFGSSLVPDSDSYSASGSSLISDSPSDSISESDAESFPASASSLPEVEAAPTKEVFSSDQGLSVMPADYSPPSLSSFHKPVQVPSPADLPAPHVFKPGLVTSKPIPGAAEIFAGIEGTRKSLPQADAQTLPRDLTIDLSDESLKDDLLGKLKMLAIEDGELRTLLMQRNPDHLPHLIEFIQTRPEPVRLSYVARELGYYQDPAVPDVLASLLYHDDQRVALAAIQGLQNYGGTTAVLHLCPFLHSEMPMLVDASKTALGTFGPQKILAAFAELPGNADERVRDGGVFVLSRMRGRPVSELLQKMLISDRSELIRKKIILAMTYQKDPSHINALRECMKTAGEEEKKLARKAIVYLQGFVPRPRMPEPSPKA